MIFGRKKGEVSQTSEIKDNDVRLSLSDIEELIEKIVDGKLREIKKREKKQAEIRKRETEGYLLPSDIQEIIEEYTPIEQRIREQEGEVTDSYNGMLCDLVEESIQLQKAEMISRRKIERAKECTTEEARDYYQTPRYFRPWYRLFRRTPNYAMKLIYEQEAQIARLVHMQQQAENDGLRSKADETESSYKRYKKRETEPCGYDVSEEEDGGAELPARKKRAKQTAVISCDISETGEASSEEDE